jgi:hypothetical protein
MNVQGDSEIKSIDIHNSALGVPGIFFTSSLSDKKEKGWKSLPPKKW